MGGPPPARAGAVTLFRAEVKGRATETLACHYLKRAKVSAHAGRDRCRGQILQFKSTAEIESQLMKTLFAMQSTPVYCSLSKMFASTMGH